MPDAVIRADAIQAAPAGYKVPGAQEILVKSVRAVVDGSGAASSFDAVLQLIDPAGNIVWQAPTGVSIAAGGSADVTWFPGIAVTAAAAAASSTSWAVCNFPGPAVNVAAGGHATFGSSTGVEKFHTNDSSMYQLALNVGLNRYGIQILKFGHYMLFASFEVPVFGAGAVDLAITLDDGPAEVTTTAPYTMEEVLTSTPVYGNGAAVVRMSWVGLVQVTTGSGGLPNPTVWFVTNSGANTATVSGEGYHIFNLDNIDSFVN